MVSRTAVRKSEDAYFKISGILKGYNNATRPI